MVISLIPRSLEALEFGYKIPTLYILSEIVNWRLKSANDKMEVEKRIEKLGLIATEQVDHFNDRLENIHHQHDDEKEDRETQIAKLTFVRAFRFYDFGGQKGPGGARIVLRTKYKFYEGKLTLATKMRQLYEGKVNIC